MQRLQVSKNRRFLTKEDGTPFFWLGDTAWELFHRASREEAQLYLENRAERGFTVIQAVALAEHDGLRVPNAYGCLPLGTDTNGNYDPTQPEVTAGDDYDYWDHVDYIIDLAASLGLYIGLLPTWGDKYNQKWGKGPVVFDADSARVYGSWLGQRYRDRPNIVWVLGGDRPLETAGHFSVVNAMAWGIKEGDKGTHLMTFHPMGGYSSSYHVHDEEWLDFNMIQSGHGKRHMDNYQMIASDYAREPRKPTLDGEPRYEDHPVGFKAENGYFDAADVRQAAYWSVFAGGFGVTYGHHSIWSMTTEPSDYFIMDWKRAIVRPGGEQLQHLRRLMESRSFLERVPDQDLLAHNYPGANHLQATRGSDYAFIYTPNGLAIEVVLGKLTGSQVRAHWYNPRSGEMKPIGVFANEGVLSFSPPSSGRGQDWVLVLDGQPSRY